MEDHLKLPYKWMGGCTCSTLPLRTRLAVPQVSSWHGDHPVTTFISSLISLVAIQHAKVDIRLTKDEANQHWENIGSLLPGNGQMIAKNNRGKCHQRL